MSDMTVANTILQQLGGRRFMVMTGSKHFVGSENSLSFKVGSNDKRVTHVRVTLLPSDTYKVEALKIRNLVVTVADEADGIYCDVLADVFTRMTGLYTRF
jgi:hypothetical protein